ncbi:unnamed protein product [Calicophoron daubneyi]|uniref:histone deacetylase n=1 Tax=Calicophoron daubneyi TaxID=300641 RepID=A0AAV2TBF4_CALDB
MSIGVVFSDEFRKSVSTSPKFSSRFAVVMDLLNAYNILNHVLRIPPLTWTRRDAFESLSAFHSADYLDSLYKLQEIYQARSEPEISQSDEELFDSYGLSYDCPGFATVFDYAVSTVRGSLAAADALIKGYCSIAINWAGGWHHAKRSEASGFCYLNDIVLSIQRFLKSSSENQLGLNNHSDSPSNRILYVDLDLHHGDGVEEAFWYSPRVVTFSVHHASPGFFPGTGTWVQSDENDGNPVFPSGAGRGRYAAFNLPLAEGADDNLWSNAVCPVLNLLYTLIHPIYVVVQCGSDCLATDPHQTFNLTNRYPAVDDPTDEDSEIEICMSGYLRALKQILSWQVPTLILGGGGYNFPDTARLWTKLTALAIEHKEGVFSIPPEIPDHSFLSLYGPDFGVNISRLPRINYNRMEEIKAHHHRLLLQACSYASLNGLKVTREELENKLQNSSF